MDRIAALDPDDVPNGEAISQLLWAKTHEDEFRQMYDAKRMPSRGIVDDAFQINKSKKKKTSKSTGSEAVEQLLKHHQGDKLPDESLEPVAPKKPKGQS